MSGCWTKIGKTRRTKRIRLREHILRRIFDAKVTLQIVQNIKQWYSETELEV